MSATVLPRYRSAAVHGKAVIQMIHTCGRFYIGHSFCLKRLKPRMNADERETGVWSFFRVYLQPKLFLRYFAVAFFAPGLCAAGAGAVVSGKIMVADLM